MHEVDGTFSEGYVPECTGKIRADRFGFLDMYPNDFMNTDGEFVGNVVAPSSEVAEIGIDLEPGRAVAS